MSQTYRKNNGESYGLLTGEVGETSDHLALFQSDDSYAGRRRLEHTDAEWTALDVLVTVHYPNLPVSWSTHTRNMFHFTTSCTPCKQGRLHNGGMVRDAPWRKLGEFCDDDAFDRVYNNKHVNTT